MKNINRLMPLKATFVTLIALLALSGTVLAKDSPLKLTVASDGSNVMAVNASSKYITFVALDVTISIKFTDQTRIDHMTQLHDLIAKPSFPPGGQLEVVHHDPDLLEKLPNAKYTDAQVTFVEFADGSTWGTPSESVKGALARRKIMLDFYGHALNAFSTGGESALTELLQKEAATGGYSASKARFLLGRKEESGVQVVVEYLQNHINAARRHANLFH
jgi:hypothetical protein